RWQGGAGPTARSPGHRKGPPGDCSEPRRARDGEPSKGRPAQGSRLDGPRTVLGAVTPPEQRTHSGARVTGGTGCRAERPARGLRTGRARIGELATDNNARGRLSTR